MNRRNFVAVAGAAAAMGAPADSPKPCIIELRRIQLRNGADNQRQRITEFFEKQGLPAYQRAGAGPVGFFAVSIGPDSPYILTVVSYPSLAGMEQIRGKMSADAEYQKALETFNSQPGLNYVRINTSLLRAFEGFPTVEPPPNAGKRPSRIFELRMYESNNLTTLRKKVKMFNDGEAGIFKRLGMQPVFFGETIVGDRQPNLVYMLSYEDLAGRDKAWKAFGSDPEWQKLRATPGYSDAEIVSNISNAILTPLPFSPIR